MNAARVVVLGHGFDKLLPLGYHPGRVTLAGVQALFFAAVGARPAPARGTSGPQVAHPAPARPDSTQPGWHPAAGPYTYRPRARPAHAPTAAAYGGARFWQLTPALRYAPGQYVGSE